MKRPLRIILAALVACAGTYEIASSQAAPPGGVTLPAEYSQSDPAWADSIVLGTSTKKMSSKGCMITIAADLLQFYGYSLVPDPYTQGNPLVSLDPGTLNRFLRAYHPGTADLSWPTLLNLVNSGPITFAPGPQPSALELRQYKPGDDFCCTNGVSQCEVDYLRFYLNQSKPVHVRVNGRADPTICRGHSLVVRQHVKFPLGSTWQLIYSDPGRSIPQDGEINNVAWRQVRPLVPQGAPSPGGGEIAFATQALDIGVERPVLASPPTLLAVNALGTNRVLIVDELGRRAGTDSVGTAYSEIPGSSATTGEYNDDDPPIDFELSWIGSATTIDEALSTGTIISIPASGIYRVRVWGDSDALATVNAFGASTSAARTFTGGATSGRTYSYSLPSDVGTGSLTAGDRAMLSQRLLIPIPPDGSRVYVGDTGLVQGLYANRPAIHGLDATRGAVGFVLGDVTTVGANKEIQSIQLYTAYPRGANRPPVAAWNSATVPAGTTLNLLPSTLLANDTDPDLDMLTVTAVGNTPDTHGTVNLDGSGIHYTPTPGFSGQALFVYEIRDPSGNYGAAGVQVAVTPAVGVDDGPPSGNAALQSWPRPTRGVLFVRCRLNGEGPAVLTLADVAGRTLVRRTLSGAGFHNETLGEVAGLPAGVYLLQLDEGGRVTTDRVVVVK